MPRFDYTIKNTYKETSCLEHHIPRFKMHLLTSLIILGLQNIQESEIVKWTIFFKLKLKGYYDLDMKIWWFVDAYIVIFLSAFLEKIFKHFSSMLDFEPLSGPQCWSKVWPIYNPIYIFLGCLHSNIIVALQFVSKIIYFHVYSFYIFHLYIWSYLKVPALIWG